MATIKFIKRSFDYLLLVSLVFIILYILPWELKPIDIPLHDSYYVIEFNFVFFISALILFVHWAIYALCHHWLYSQRLMKWHVWIIISHIVILTLIIYYSIQDEPIKQTRQAFNSEDVFESHLFDLTYQCIFSITFTVLILTFVLGELILFCNLVMGLIKKVKTKYIR